MSAVVFVLLPLIGVFVVWLLSFVDIRFANLLYKLQLLRLAVLHLLFSTDKKWKKQFDSAKLTGSEEYSKRLIFVRHGESAWNLVFNKGFNKTLPKRAGDAIAKELSLAMTVDSVFVDSPMSEEGCEQAQGLQDFIEKAEDSGFVPILKGEEGKSVICSSNLRRALSTATIGFWERLKRTQEKIHVLSHLQEITFNVDGVALAKPHTAPPLSDDELGALNIPRSKFEPDRFYDCSENAGDKEIQGCGVDRIKAFCDWCFTRDEPIVIAAGHSLYFRAFFQTFLARDSTHKAKQFKMKNCSIVSFNLFKGVKNGKVRYKIEDDSIEEIYLGFEEKKSKSKKKKD